MQTDANISNLYNPAPKIKLNGTIADLFTKGGFNLVDFIFILVGIFFFVSLIIAGWEFMLSSGDQKKVTAASTRITNSLIGLIMAVSAFIIVRLFTNILGLGNLV